MNRTMKDLLNTHQRNSLRITLQMLEENLRHALEWLDGREENGILYNRKLDMPKQKREQARREIQTALGLIENLSIKFNLPKDTSDAASLFRGELSIRWTNLLDTRAKKLSRFGKTHPDLAKTLDPNIQNLAEVTMRLSALLGESQQEKP